MDQDITMQKEFTLEELSTYNGLNGKPEYVAINGTVYDMGEISAWRGGTHFGLYAGKDLSVEFMECHEGMKVILDMLTKVGTLKN